MQTENNSTRQEKSETIRLCMQIPPFFFASVIFDQNRRPMRGVGMIFLRRLSPLDCGVIY